MLDSDKGIGECFNLGKQNEDRQVTKAISTGRYELKLDSYKNEYGYLLIESLLSLILLSMITLSLITVLPILADASARLDKEQAIYHRLFELYIQETKEPHRVTEPYEFDVFRRGDKWCASYVWGDGGRNEKTICL